MSGERRPGYPTSAGVAARPGRPGSALGHPLREALLRLMAERATLTSTEAARELGESSGACSFHLRQLERYGLIEAVPGQHGRARPWRLVAARPQHAGAAGQAGTADEFGELARELENEGYRRWLAGRDSAPPGWHDEAFSTVLYLTPAQLAEVAGAIRAVIASFDASAGPAQGQAGEALPVGVVARIFPLLPAASDD
jgi:hypothetical protein